MATLQFKDDCDSMKVGLHEFDSSWTWQANELRAIGWSRDVEMEKRFSSQSVICHSFVLDADVKLIECGKSLAILRRNLGPILPMTKRALMLGHQGPRLMDYLQGIVMSSPRPRFEAAIKAIELWLVDKVVLPIENTFGGSIHRNYDLLLRHRFHIVGKVQLAVNHCLLELPGVKKDDLKRVLCHPQALAQYEMEPIFPKADRLFKTSIVFTLEEGPGVLFKALVVFAMRDINLTKIESRPWLEFNANHWTWFQHSCDFQSSSHDVGDGSVTWLSFQADVPSISK
ncbi:hypothetical protein GIB67_005791, partial [Kingdonia uniflora]